MTALQDFSVGLDPDIHQCMKVIASGKVGVFAGRLCIDKVKSGRNFSSTKNTEGDRFQLLIPYAGRSISCIVLFDSSQPKMAPDFLFEDSTFLVNASAATLKTELPNLSNWNPKDPKAFLNAVQELLVLYKNHQITLLQKNMRLHLEYFSLMELGLVAEEDIEVYFGRQAQEEVHFLIRLALDITKLPKIMQPSGNAADNMAALLVSYHPTDITRVSSQLFLSPSLDETLGGNKNLQIPSYSSEHSLGVYVPQILDLLKDKIDSISRSYLKRKNFLESLLNLMGRAALEFDSLHFMKVVFLFEWNDFSFIVQICLSPNFPDEKPYYLFQSIYHTILGKPFTSKCIDFPYSPRWDSMEMAERAKTFIQDHVETFQNVSIRSK